MAKSFDILITEWAGVKRTEYFLLRHHEGKRVLLSQFIDQDYKRQVRENARDLRLSSLGIKVQHLSDKRLAAMRENAERKAMLASPP